MEPGVGTHTPRMQFAAATMFSRVGSLQGGFVVPLRVRSLHVQSVEEEERREEES